MDISLGTVLAALLPTVVLVLVSFMFKRWVNGMDGSIKDLQVKVDAVDRKVGDLNLTTHERITRQSETVHKRISEMDKEVAVLGEKIKMHLKGDE